MSIDALNKRVSSWMQTTTANIFARRVVAHGVNLAGDAEPQKSIDGAGLVRTSGAAGLLEAITFTCNALTDCITLPAAPASGEIYLASGFTAGKKRVRFTFHTQKGSPIPMAAGAYVTVNNGDEATAIARFTTADNGPSITAYTAFLQRRMISLTDSVAEYNFEGETTTVDDIAVGFILPVGTGVDSCYVNVEVW